MPGVSSVNSNVRDLRGETIGNGEKTQSPPPPRPKDSISGNQSDQGVSDYLFSFVSRFFYTLFDILGVVCSWFRWPFEWIGILSPTIEWQMQHIEKSFKNKNDWERLHFLAYEIALLEGPGIESFFIKLFTQQEIVVEALIKLCEHLPSDLKNEVFKKSLPRCLYQAFSKKPKERTFSDIRFVEMYRAFMFKFPDYVLHYVNTCFSKSNPSSHRFDALCILFAYDEYDEEEYYHIVGLDKEKMEEALDKEESKNLKALNEAKLKYYQMLSKEEKEKLLLWSNGDDFLKAEPEDQANWCKYAFEAEPDIFKMRLETIVAGNDKQRVAMANKNILRNGSHALTLFDAYCKEYIKQLEKKSIDQKDTELKPLDHLLVLSDWLQNNESNAFIEGMQGVAMTQEYQNAAKAVIDAMES